MKCYCYETETEFVFCVEDADAKLEDNLKAAWFKKTDKGFIKIYNHIFKITHTIKYLSKKTLPETTGNFFILHNLPPYFLENFYHLVYF
jgi:hypothetical protein